ncbi:hypothetical protein GCM10009793_10760 [Brachybacterium phenoliresistens]
MLRWVLGGMTVISALPSLMRARAVRACALDGSTLSQRGAQGIILGDRIASDERRGRRRRGHPWG